MALDSNLIQEWEALSRHTCREEETKFSSEAMALLNRFPWNLIEEEKAWFESALRDERLKWFVLWVMHERGEVPVWLVSPLLRAAVYEVDPSSNRSFIEPVSLFYGRRRVFEELLGYARSGTDFEKAGAINAFYWAHLRSGFRWDGGERELSDDVRDLRAKVRHYLLQEFVINPKVEVRRNIISQLNLNGSAYPVELQPLVSRAIEIAREHTDDYIRHRSEIQLGNSGPLQPLPSRSRSTRDSSLVSLVRSWFKRAE